MIILLIFGMSLLFNIYTLIVNGLRKQDEHEFQETESSSQFFYNQTFECDVLQEYKPVYDFMMIIYVAVAIITPLLLICYFNIYITRVLMTRKKRMLRHFFAQLDQRHRQNQHLFDQEDRLKMQQQKQSTLSILENSQINDGNGNILEMIDLTHKKKQKYNQDQMQNKNSFEYKIQKNNNKCICIGGMVIEKIVIILK